MKIKLIFDSENEDDMNNYGQMMQASKMYCAIFDICQKLRSYDKHGHTFKNANEAVAMLRTEVMDIVLEYGLQDIL